MDEIALINRKFVKNYFEDMLVEPCFFFIPFEYS